MTRKRLQRENGKSKGGRRTKIFFQYEKKAQEKAEKGRGTHQNGSSGKVGKGTSTKKSVASENQQGKPQPVSIKERSQEKKIRNE